MVGWDGLRNVPAYVERFFARPAVVRARNIPAVPR
jgi:GST-like protein